jgi:hypothetical protein
MNLKGAMMPMSKYYMLSVFPRCQDLWEFVYILHRVNFTEIEEQCSAPENNTVAK